MRISQKAHGSKENPKDVRLQVIREVLLVLPLPKKTQFVFIFQAVAEAAVPAPLLSLD